MVTSFLIATLILFSLNIILNLISLGVVLSEENTKRAINISVTIFIYLIITTWNVFALISI